MKKSKIAYIFRFIKKKFDVDDKEQVYHVIKDNGPVDYLVAAISAAFVFISYYKIAFTIMSEGIETDLSCHAEFAEQFYLKKDLFLQAWIRVPYMLWHIIVKFLQSRMGFPLGDAVSMTYALFGVFSFAIMTLFTYRVVKYYSGKMSLGLAAFGAVMLSYVSAYAKWWYSASIYLGQFGPNPFHNPTHMAVKGFGLLSAMAGIDIIKNLRGEKLMFFKSSKGLYVCFGVMLFLSTLTKPTFMYMLLPAGLIYLVGTLIYYIIKKRDKVSDALTTLLFTSLATLPSLLMIAFEYLAFYKWGTQYASKVVIGSFLETWHMFAFDVPTSILLAMFFPVWMVVTNPGYFLKTTEGLLSGVCYVVGTFEFAFIQEAGLKQSAANFSWCMMAGMTVLFTTCVAKLIHNTIKKDDSAIHVGYIIVSWVFLFLHVYSGYTIIMDLMNKHII